MIAAFIYNCTVHEYVSTFRIFSTVTLWDWGRKWKWKEEIYFSWKFPKWKYECVTFYSTKFRFNIWKIVKHIYLVHKSLPYALYFCMYLFYVFRGFEIMFHLSFSFCLSRFKIIIIILNFFLHFPFGSERFIYIEKIVISSFAWA